MNKEQLINMCGDMTLGYGFDSYTIGFGVNFELKDLNSAAVLSLIKKYDKDLYSQIMSCSEYSDFPQTPVFELDGDKIEEVMENCYGHLGEFLADCLNKSTDLSDFVFDEDNYGTQYILWEQKYPWEYNGVSEFITEEIIQDVLLDFIGENNLIENPDDLFFDSYFLMHICCR